MSTGTDIVQRALQQIGAHSIVAPATPDAVVFGKEQLNAMMEMWLSKGIKIGFTPLDAAGNNLNETSDTTDAIIYNLAVRLSPAFDNGKQIVSQTLVQLANSSFRDIKAQYQRITIPKLVPSSTLPRGQGNNFDFFRQPFVGQDAEID